MSKPHLRARVVIKKVYGREVWKIFVDGEYKLAYNKLADAKAMARYIRSLP